MKNKIIQIIPASVNMFAEFNAVGADPSHMSRIVCLALTDNGDVLPMGISDCGVYDVTEASNFDGLVFK